MAACLKLNPSLAPNVLGLPAEYPVAQGNGPWSPQEDSALLATLMMYTAEDWAKVANKMGTGRGAIECERRMQMIGRTPLPASKCLAALEGGAGEQRWGDADWF